MRSDLIEVLDLTLRPHLCFKHRVKEFAIQEFCSHTSMSLSLFHSVISDYHFYRTISCNALRFYFFLDFYDYISLC